MAISKSSSIESMMDEIPVKPSDKKRDSLKSGMMNFGRTENSNTDIRDKSADVKVEKVTEEVVTEMERIGDVNPVSRKTPENRILTSRVEQIVKPKHPGGRPKMYEGEQAIITIKTEKRIKDMAQRIVRSRKISMVQYLNELIERDYYENYGD